MKTFSKNSLIISLAAFFAIGYAGSTALAGNPEAVVDLGSAGNFVILGKTAVTNTGTSVITGDVGLSPAAASFITGFAPTMDPSNTFSTSALVTGKIYAADYTAPTPAYMTGAVSAMEAAYTNAANRTAPNDTNRAAGIITGQTFTPGLYKWTTDVTLAGVAGTTTDDVVLDAGGNANAVWIFQIAGDLTAISSGSVADGAHIVLANGAQSKNVFWQVAGSNFGATIGTYNTFRGTILSLKQVRLQTGAVLDGRALAQTQVTLDSNTISGAPAPATLRVVKQVVIERGGTATPASFNLHVKNNLGVDVPGSPLAGTSTPGTPYTLSAGTYTVSEDAPLAGYMQSFSGACDQSGNITLAGGDNKTCTITNIDLLLPSVGSGGTREVVVAPLIDVVKTASPLSLPTGPGLVQYTYTLRNVGTVPVTGITMVGDTCSPIVLVSGDTNNDAKLDVNETWVYNCSATLSQTHTNTVVATGWANGLTATDIASATVIVGAPIQPPLVHITKIPSPLALRAGGGVVTYTETVTNPGTVALSNVRVTDDKCAATTYLSGDTNRDSKLDVNESWVYTCQSRITQNTTNIAQVTGEANGLTARDLAIATVLVAAPSLPNTGVAPSGKGLARAEAIAAFHRSLGMGAKGKDVEVLQTALEEKGLLEMPEGVAKGYFGALTRKAVEKYQEGAGLPKVGTFGPKTREKLTSELSD